MTEKSDSTVIQIRPTPAIESVVEYLERSGGDLSVLGETFKEHGINGHRIAIFQIERQLLDHADTTLKERWDKAIELFHLTRMRLLQREAIKILETIDYSEDKEGRLKLGFAKLILGDLLAASTVTAKAKAGAKVDRSSNLDDIKEIMSTEEEVI